MSGIGQKDSPSILFTRREDRLSAKSANAPAYFPDLNLDQIVDAVTSGRSDHDLKPFFYFSLNHVDAIRYRHEVFQDLEMPASLGKVKSFTQRMHDVRVLLALVNKLHDRFHRERWFLHAVEIYCDAVNQLAADLAAAPLKSPGLGGFRDYLTAYAAGSDFKSLLQEAQGLTANLSTINYRVLLRAGSFTVANYESETDYSAEIEQTFEKFKQGAVKDYKVEYRSAAEDMNHVEAKILEFVAQLNPEPFSRLLDFCARRAGFLDETIAAFDHEIQFYIAFLEYLEKFKRAGLRFCYPQFSSTSKEVCDYEGFDLALAQKLIEANSSIVCNDFFLKGQERVIIISGPNQGGKTTFARAFGQLHHLASLGCPVPGRKARPLLFDRLFTHFEREEKVENLRGKLEDDLARIHATLKQATSRSIIIMNEIFTSTTIQDEIFLSKNVMERIAELDLLCVWVTFVDELASFGPQTVSMLSTIVPENPAARTFKIVRRPADGLAYAMAIAEKHRLTHGHIRERMKS
jgi:DNA mismatch repair protein MutS